MQNSTVVNGYKKSEKHRIAAYGIAAAAFFLFFAFFDGPFLEADSESYLTMNIFREPGYPLFLALCRLLPGSAVFPFDGYAGLWYAVILQSLLWTFAVVRFAMLVEEVTEKSGCNEKKAAILAWSSIVLQFAVCLVYRFASGRGALFSCSVLTESLTMPLYVLFICRLFYLMRDEGKKNIICCACCALVLIAVRKHMTVTLIVWGFAVFVLRLLVRQSRQMRTFLLHAGVILAVFFVSGLLTKCYNLALFGTFSPQAGRSEGMMCMLLYTADEADVELFREDEQRQRAWFVEIARQQEERGARYEDAPRQAGWTKRYTYFMNQYDVIGYGIVHDVLFETAEETLGADAPPSAKTREMYELEGTLIKPLLRQDLRDYVRVYTDNLLAGLAYSNARASRTLLPVSLMMYVLYAVLFMRCVRKRMQTGNDAALLAFLVLAGLVINAASVAAVIFSQPRYNIYSMAMFYAMFPAMMNRFQ